MELSNKKRTIKIKRLYTISMLCIVLIAALCFWLDKQLIGFIFGGLFIAGLTIMQFFQVNYIYYNSNENTFVIRYHPVSSLFSSTYSSIDFDKNLLYKASITRSNAFADLCIHIKTQRGILEYPDVSLVGLSNTEIELIEKDMQNIIARNKELWRQS
ncbi:MAG: hypothetical protein ACK5MI_06500 [Mangrovibacterium sp.]